MPRPNPSPQWQEPTASGAGAAIGRWYLATDEGGALYITSEVTAISMREDVGGALRASDDASEDTPRTASMNDQVVFLY